MLPARFDAGFFVTPPLIDMPFERYLRDATPRAMFRRHAALMP